MRFPKFAYSADEKNQRFEEVRRIIHSRKMDRLGGLVANVELSLDWRLGLIEEGRVKKKVLRRLDLTKRF